MLKNKFEICGEITKIFLKRKDGSYITTIIDTEDLPKTQSLKHSWCAYFHKHTQSYYVRGYAPSGRILLHRLIMDAPSGLMVDHIFHDTLDNRKSKLRLVTNAENGQNRKCVIVNSKSGIRNVYWHDLNKCWRVALVKNGEKISGGCFKKISKAAKAAEVLRKKHLV